MAPQILLLLLQKPSASSQLDVHFVQTAVCIVLLMLEKEPELTRKHILEQLMRPLESRWGREYKKGVEVEGSEYVLSEDVRHFYLQRCRKSLFYLFHT
jgi:hypothetical protein